MIDDEPCPDCGNFNVHKAGCGIEFPPPKESQKIPALDKRAEGYAPGFKKIVLHVNEVTGETHVDGKPCIGHEDYECECARRLFEISYASIVKPLREKAEMWDMDPDELILSILDDRAEIKKANDALREKAEKWEKQSHIWSKNVVEVADARDAAKKDRDDWKERWELAEKEMASRYRESAAKVEVSLLKSQDDADRLAEALTDMVEAHESDCTGKGCDMMTQAKEALAAHEALKGKT